MHSHQCSYWYSSRIYLFTFNNRSIFIHIYLCISYSRLYLLTFTRCLHSHSTSYIHSHSWSKYSFSIFCAPPLRIGQYKIWTADYGQSCKTIAHASLTTQSAFVGAKISTWATLEQHIPNERSIVEKWRYFVDFLHDFQRFSFPRRFIYRRGIAFSRFKTACLMWLLTSRLLSLSLNSKLVIRYSLALNTINIG